MAPAHRVIAVGAGPAPRSTAKRRGKAVAAITERRVILGASLPTRRGIRVPRSCSALPEDESAED
ncbi:hypothetical protein CRM89_01830 [Nocardia sp. FDAARGOS_372]|nr:hypothetical protein DXT66_08365 [Nocardia farcinica]PEH74884.1 hypothetical protein CRM89_01830 [Nocardia sp. FDAARGOS_372]